MRLNFFSSKIPLPPVNHFGWRRDLPDHRDVKYRVVKPITLPPSIDLRSFCEPVYDQGDLGSCTANAIAAHLDFNRRKQGETAITPSRLFIYYNERLMEGTIDSDAGATIRDSIKEIVKYGACRESSWPYILSKFAVKPSKMVYRWAIDFRALTYLRVDRDQELMQQCLAKRYPFVVGISVYSSFYEGNSTGQIPLPPSNDKFEGGHAIMIVGYNEKGFIFRNSWGDSWGDRGYGYLPFEYLLDNKYSADFWTLRTVE